MGGASSPGLAYQVQLFPSAAVIRDFRITELSSYPLQPHHRLHVARYLLIDVRHCARSRKHILSKRKHVHTF